MAGTKRQEGLCPTMVSMFLRRTGVITFERMTPPFFLLMTDPTDWQDPHHWKEAFQNETKEPGVNINGKITFSAVF